MKPKRRTLAELLAPRKRKIRGWLSKLKPADRTLLLKLREAHEAGKNECPLPTLLEDVREMLGVRVTSFSCWYAFFRGDAYPDVTSQDPH